MAQESEAKESFDQLEMLQRTHDKLRSKADHLEAVHDKLFSKLEIVKKTLMVSVKNGAWFADHRPRVHFGSTDERKFQLFTGKGAHDQQRGQRDFAPSTGGRERVRYAPVEPYGLFHTSTQH